ncbi:MAG: DUF169 domain-containing protein [Chloroflexota bacterium]|nr:DUF169 domain-containing protein [Chloroflexota bacterium]
MNNADYGRALVDDLGLDRPPVALAFLDVAPAGVTTAEGLEPSACTFWRQAEQGVFYVGAERHLECPIGAMTMGFELPPERAPEAEQLVGMMVDLQYFSLEEVEHLPSVKQPHRGILYGPLAEFPVQPDVVLMIATPRQGMLLAEASESVALRAAPALPTMGRPACAAVAWSANDATVTLSLGCIGARTYVEVPDDRAIVVLPGTVLDRIAERLGVLARANHELASFHARRKAQYAAGAVQR